MSSLLSLLFVFQFVGDGYAESSGRVELTGLLADQLGVTQDQATGGAGALFKMAKNNLSENDFAAVANALPCIDTLIQSAPEVSDSATGLSEKIGGATKGLGSLTKAAESASNLHGSKGKKNSVY